MAIVIGNEGRNSVEYAGLAIPSWGTVDYINYGAGTLFDASNILFGRYILNTYVQGLYLTEIDKIRICKSAVNERTEQEQEWLTHYETDMKNLTNSGIYPTSYINQYDLDGAIMIKTIDEDGNAVMSKVTNLTPFNGASAVQSWLEDQKDLADLFGFTSIPQSAIDDLIINP